MPSTSEGWDHDYQFGRQGELLVGRLLDQLAARQSRIEDKSSRRPDLSFFVEVAQNARGRGRWTPSGLSVTQAEYWAIVKPDGIVVFVPTGHLRQEVDRLLRAGRRYTEVRSANPTRGMWIDLAHVFRRVADPARCPEEPASLFDQERSS